MGVLDDLKNAAADVAGVDEYREERAEEVAREGANDWFPNIRHGSEFVLDNPNFSFREQTARWADDAAPDDYSDPSEVGKAALSLTGPGMALSRTGVLGGSREGFQEDMDRADLKEAIEADEDAGWTEGFARDVLAEEVDLGTQFATGVDIEGERTSTGFWATTYPAFWAGGPITKGAGKAARTLPRMANRGTLSSARQAMKRPATYLPERMRPIGGAPARQPAREGVQGATGNVVRKVDDATTAIGNRVDSIPFGRTLAATGSVAGIIGGVGSALGPMDVSDGNTGATKVEPVDSWSSPFGQVLRLRDNESVLGYVTITDSQPRNPESQPDSVTLLADQRGTTTQASFPPEPTFDSLGAARQAYHEWADRRADPPQGSQGFMDMGPYGKPDSDEWEAPTHTMTLDGGWHLYDQPHREEARERFVVAARSTGGSIIYLDGDAEADASFAAFKEHGEALGAHQRWLADEQNGRIPATDERPDPNADRPTPNEVGGQNEVGVLGFTASNDTLVKVGAVALAVLGGLLLFGGL